MSLDIFKTIIDILAREKVKLVYLYQSGEPFLHTDVYEFIALTAEKGINSSIATKLSTPIDFRRLDLALERCDQTGHKVELVITVDSLRAEVMPRIAPGIDVSRVKQNLEQVSKLKKSHRCVKVVCSTIVNKYNEDELEDIKSLMAQLHFTNWHAETFGYYMSYLATDEDIDMVRRYVPQNPAYRKRLSVEQGKVVGLRKRCPFPGTPAIDVEGNVTICCHDMTHSLNLGNVLESGSVRKVIDSALFQDAYKASQKMQLDICKGCN